MQISSANLYIKLSLEDIKTLLRMGEKIDVKIVDKIDDNNYLIKLKNKTLRAYSTVLFKKGDSATLVVEKMHPSVLLKLIDAAPKDFISAKNLKMDIKKIDLEHTEKQTDKVKDIVSIIKNSKDEIQDAVSKLKSAVDLFQDSVKTLKHNQQNSFFVQLPVNLSKDEDDTIYLQKEERALSVSKDGQIRVVLYASPKSVGDIKIDMLYSKNRLNCSLFCSSSSAYDLLNSHKDQIEEMLGGNATINIDILNEKLEFFRKQIDLKI
jgi:3'-phosphoadenosine 5'-phosphosulfate sulfotransferase